MVKGRADHGEQGGPPLHAAESVEAFENGFSETGEAALDRIYAVLMSIHPGAPFTAAELLEGIEDCKQVVGLKEWKAIKTEIPDLIQQAAQHRKEWRSEHVHEPESLVRLANEDGSTRFAFAIVRRDEIESVKIAPEADEEIVAETLGAPAIEMEEPIEMVPEVTVAVRKTRQISPPEKHTVLEQETDISTIGTPLLDTAGDRELFVHVDETSFEYRDWVDDVRGEVVALVRLLIVEPRHNYGNKVKYTTLEDRLSSYLGRSSSAAHRLLVTLTNDGTLQLAQMYGATWITLNQPEEARQYLPQLVAEENKNTDTHMPWEHTPQAARAKAILRQLIQPNHSHYDNVPVSTMHKLIQKEFTDVEWDDIEELLIMMCRSGIVTLADNPKLTQSASKASSIHKVVRIGSRETKETLQQLEVCDELDEFLEQALDPLAQENFEHIA